MRVKPINFQPSAARGNVRAHTRTDATIGAIMRPGGVTIEEEKLVD